ncbi:MAG: hypothetical protein R2747_15360 [Pyrinomonadaceae bacterium]
MPFNPKLLPPTVYDVYKKGPGLWVLTVKTAVEVGIRDINKLTDIAFYQHNPDLKGRSIKLGENGLIEQWQYFQRLVKGILKSYPAKVRTLYIPESSPDHKLEDEIFIDSFSWG